MENELNGSAELPKKSSKWKWILGIVLILLILIAIGPAKKLFSKRELGGKFIPENRTREETEAIKDAPAIDSDNPPKFIQTDWVELDKVYMVSKFRSGTGHDFSVNSGETCRSMKHYFASMDPNQPDYKKLGGGDKTKYPIPTVDKDVKIFSPVDGTLRFFDFDRIAFDHELQVTPDAYPNFTIRMMHVQNVPGIKEGKVKSGELIGLVLANQSFDLAIETQVTGPNKTRYISYFAAMPDNIFAKYQARGVKTREDLITTKEYRDTHPFSCHGNEVFDENYAFDDPVNNLVYLSGFTEVNNLINAKYKK